VKRQTARSVQIHNDDLSSDDSAPPCLEKTLLSRPLKRVKVQKIDNSKLNIGAFYFTFGFTCAKTNKKKHR